MDFAYQPMILPASRLVFAIWLAFTVVGGRSTLADPDADASKGLKSKVLLDNLDNPSGLALRPLSSGELFVAESGAGRVLRVRLNEPPESTVAVEGFPRDNFGAEPGHS